MGAQNLDLHGVRPPQEQPCPQCGHAIWHQRLTYRECLHCRYKDGQTVQEILRKEDV